MLLFQIIDFYSAEWFFFLIAAFTFGAVIGSFLNVVIHRLPLDESIAFPASHCPACNSPIKFYDNVPILSWLILGGKCRSCKNPISARYPLVEALTGLVFAAIFWHTGLSAILPVHLAFGAALVALVFIDAEHMYLPNVINYPFLVIVLLTRLLFPLLLGIAPFDDVQRLPLSELNQPLWVVSLFGALLGALAGGGFLWLVGWLWEKLRGVEAMGLGDVKMMAMVGALLGWRLTILSIFLAAFVGAAFGVAQIVRKKDWGMQTKIPFGIYLGLGSLLALLFGDKLISWYLNTFIPN
jgi:leader peptidase (prepilin peptidase) / N-methyltransferase